MKRILQTLTYGDFQDIMLGTDVLIKTLASMNIKDLYNFVEQSKTERDFHNKRANKYRKTQKEHKIQIWNETDERIRQKKDRDWEEENNKTINNPIFWKKLWILKSTRINSKQLKIILFDSEEEYNQLPKNPSECKENFEYINTTTNELFILLKNESSVLKDTIFSFEEYLLRISEYVFKKRSMNKILKEFGSFLLNNDKLFIALKNRGNINDILDDMVNHGLLLSNEFVYKPSDKISQLTEDQKNIEVQISISDMQYMFLFMERLSKKNRKYAHFKIDNKSLMNIDSIICKFMPSHYPKKFILYVSAFIQCVLSYCIYKCNIKKDLIFINHPNLDSLPDTSLLSKKNKISRMFAYDLKHNIIFENVALYFKYNVYTFKNIGDKSINLSGLSLTENIHDLINECIEKGFNHIDPDALSQIIQKNHLVSILNSNYYTSSFGLMTKQKIESFKFINAMELEFKNAKSFSILPCFIKNDKNLLSGDVKRMKVIKQMMTSKRNNNSIHADILTYILYLYVHEMQHSLIHFGFNETALSIETGNFTSEKNKSIEDESSSSDEKIESEPAFTFLGLNNNNRIERENTILLISKYGDKKGLINPDFYKFPELLSIFYTKHQFLNKLYNKTKDFNMNYDDLYKLIKKLKFIVFKKVKIDSDKILDYGFEISDILNDKKQHKMHMLKHDVQYSSSDISSSFSANSSSGSDGDDSDDTGDDFDHRKKYSKGFKLFSDDLLNILYEDGLEKTGTNQKEPDNIIQENESGEGSDEDIRNISTEENSIISSSNSNSEEDGSIGENTPKKTAEGDKMAQKCEKNMKTYSKILDKKRKKQNHQKISVWMSNVHKDCFLFNDTFLLCQQLQK